MALKTSCPSHPAPSQQLEPGPEGFKPQLHLILAVPLSHLVAQFPICDRVGDDCGHHLLGMLRGLPVLIYAKC